MASKSFGCPDTNSDTDRFPIFFIKYFETQSVLLLIYNYFLVPAICFSVISVIVIYYEYLRSLNTKTNSKTKIILQDIFTIGFLSLITTALTCGLGFSLIITTNAYLSPQEKIIVESSVIDYELNTTRNGRLRHYIKFHSPIDDGLIRLEVYKKYAVGEIFKKGMNKGRWGILYSID